MADQSYHSMQIMFKNHDGHAHDSLKVVEISEWDCSESLAPENFILNPNTAYRIKHPEMYEASENKVDYFSFNSQDVLFVNFRN